MPWYKIANLIKIAGPKDKIKQYNVSDPSVQLFIMRYEGMIKWNGYTIEDELTGKEIPKTIKSEDDINFFIKNVLLPDLYSKADENAPGNYYVKNFDVEKAYLEARQANIFNPQLDEAYNRHQVDKADGEKFYLKVINDIKKQAFNSWINAFKENPDFHNIPAFAHMILKPVLDSSKEKKANPPASFNPAVVMATLKKSNKAIYNGPVKDDKVFKNIISLNKKQIPLEEISKQTNIGIQEIQDVIENDEVKSTNILSIYEKELNDYSIKSSKQQGNQEKDGWIVFPKKSDSTPEEFEKNIDDLTNFSVPNAWCTTRTWNGISYLTAGEFWAFVKGGRARVGFRFNGKDLVEIAGNQNLKEGVVRSCPLEYWKEVIQKVKENNLEGRIVDHAKYHWDMIVKEKALNQSFFNQDGTPNMEEVESLKSDIETKPEFYERVANNDNFARYPEILESLKTACKRGWFRRIQEMRGDDAMLLAEKAAENAQNMPDFVLADPAFQENVHGRLCVLYENNPERAKAVLEKIPNHWQVYPRGKDIFKNAVLKKYKDGLYWKANSFGVSRKTKKEKEKIAIAKNDLLELQDVIGRFMPELNEDVQFATESQQAKNESVIESIKNGYISQEMPKDTIESFFTDNNNIEQMSDLYAEKISNAHTAEFSRQTKDTVFLNEFMDKEIQAIAPAWIRKLDGFVNLKNLVKKKVLSRNIDNYSKFDQEHKDNEENYQLYKKHILENNPLKAKLLKGDEYFDERLRADPDFKKLFDDQEINPEKIIQVSNAIKINPKSYLTLDPQLKSTPEVYNAYLQRRVFTQNPALNGWFVKEFNSLPDFIQNREDCQKVYIDTLINLLARAFPGDPRYVKCEEINPIATNHPEVIRICKERENKLNKKANNGWFKKAKLAY